MGIKLLQFYSAIPIFFFFGTAATVEILLSYIKFKILVYDSVATLHGIAFRALQNYRGNWFRFALEHALKPLPHRTRETAGSTLDIADFEQWHFGLITVLSIVLLVTMGLGFFLYFFGANALLNSIVHVIIDLCNPRSNTFDRDSQNSWVCNVPIVYLMLCVCCLDS